MRNNIQDIKTQVAKKYELSKKYQSAGKVLF